MKLLTRTTLYYLLFSLPLLILSGWFLYYSIQRFLLEEIDEELINSKIVWMHHLDSISTQKDITDFSSPVMKIERTDIWNGNDSFSDTIVYQSFEHEMVPYRALNTYIKRDDQVYRISFKRSMLEQEDVFKGLIMLMCLVFGGLLLSFLVINSYISRRIWKPFSESLQKIKSINMQQLQDTSFGRTPITEFNDLNESLNAMTRKMNSDYASIKIFTQNASHEIQTPLAIIQSKLELLLQDSKLSEEQANVISSASDASQRLARLNQALLTITKIGNRQFEATEIISMNAVTEKYSSFFAELLEQKTIRYKLVESSEWKLSIHHILADMLISNLFSNAIRYTRQNGEISISITSNSWQISNSSELPALDHEHLFRRFYKNDASSVNGLGLAIAKEICDSNGLAISYLYESGCHKFTVSVLS